MSERSLVDRLEDARRACAMRAASYSDASQNRRWSAHERTIREAKAALLKATKATVSQDERTPQEQVQEVT